MVGAYVVMLVTTAAGIVWQFVALNVPEWSASGDLGIDEVRWIFMGVAIPLDAAAVLSWLLVAIAVVKGGRPPRQSGLAPQPGNYPMVAQPGYPQPDPPAQQQPPSY
ncbi:hypothetical protein [Amycolatopsis sp. NPDC051071]|uniref:hypothetical protein n=1 Tax=Amycolatopsis sp. NPDC051071 TaxID=3154637 RepID=UPI003438FADB